MDGGRRDGAGDTAEEAQFDLLRGDLAGGQRERGRDRGGQRRSFAKEFHGLSLP